ncbi:uncharacterized protein LOC128391981 [Panonychus citri]|uniref:uncharacterized protein LOC128391981 n=1 Tax=Panonychus citri TaxID=50023 RepID=UPI002306EC50|nr:uncharacterized protein LOC128391981 [Panonychus citri]
MIKGISNQLINKLDCGHYQSDVFYVHKCLKTFCHHCKQENRPCVLCKTDLIEADYLKAIDKKRCGDDSVCNNQAIFHCLCSKKDFCEAHLLKFHRKILASKRCCAVILNSSTDEPSCSKCDNFIAQFVDKTTNELFCETCSKNKSANIVPIDRDNNNHTTVNIDIDKNFHIHRDIIGNQLNLLSTKLEEYTNEIEKEKTKFNNEINHLQKELESYVNINKDQIDSLRASVDKVKQFLDLLNRNDKLGIINLIKSDKLNYKLADSKLRLWVEEIVQSYNIPELTKSGFNWIEETVLHELVPGPRNWKSNHSPFFPDNILKLTHDFIKDHLRHKILLSTSQTETTYKNDLDYFLDCSSIAGGDVTLLTETGKRALNQAVDLTFARICFEEAHRIDPNNWFVLDTLMGLHFVLNDHDNCLQLAIKGLMMDGNYFKGRVLVSEVLKRLPPLRSKLPSDLQFIDIWNPCEGHRKVEILDELVSLRELYNLRSVCGANQDDARKFLNLSLNAETLSSLKSLISVLITVHNEMTKHRVDLNEVIRLEIHNSSIAQPITPPSIDCTHIEMSNHNTKRKKKGRSYGLSNKLRLSSAKRKKVNHSCINMYKKVFSMFPESVLTRKIHQESDSEIQTQNKAQVENLILTRYMFRQKPFVSKGREFNQLISDLLYEIADQAALIKLPPKFMELYEIHRKWYPLLSTNNITPDETNLILTANEMKFNQPEAIFLTESIPYLRDLLNPTDYDKFFIRLMILRGIKESKVDYLLMANEVFKKSNLKLVQGANQTVYSFSSLRSMINEMNENNLDMLLDQHRHEEIVELLASKSELSRQEEECLCQAIQSSQQWKRGIEIIAQSKKLPDTLLNLLKSCLKNGDGTSIDQELAIKLLKLGTEDYNAMAWTCILQTFINEMRLDNMDEEKVVDLIISVHNYLGNKGWCWDFNGEFLSLSLDFLIYQVNIKREKLILNCLGCFYKQLRCNFLTAHKGTGVNLHWDNIHFIYDHFTPKKLPSFDESSDPIDSKTEELFRSLLSMIPDNLNPERYSQFISEYIDNGKPIEASSNIPKHRVTQNIYYYLADYYLKHKDFKKAIKFYILDLTLNLDRFDSWVGCALSLADEIEQYSSPAKLSSFLLIY